MLIIRSILNIFVLWGAWIIIPVLMEIVPAIGNIILLIRRRIRGVNFPVPRFCPPIAIIVPVYNSASTLHDCLASINDGTYPKDKIHIYLVDNGSNDASFDMFNKSQHDFADLKMQWCTSQQGKSRAMNMALYNSKCEYIINIDSDGVLHKDALLNLISKFEAKPKLNVMTGAILTSPIEIEKYKGFFARLLRKLEFMEYAQAFLAGRSYASETDSVYTLSGAFSAFRRSAIMQSRMYNTDTITEDTHMTFQMRYLQGEKIEICENAIFLTDPIESMNHLYTQRQRWQRGSLEVAHMFMDDRFRPLNILKNVNVRTVIYDHTFAFPRVIWYMAMLCLMALNYSPRVVLIPTLIIYALYILIAYLNFIPSVVFLRPMPEFKKYYLKHWWCVLIMPLFNLLVFFFRLAGIINSIGTDSSWRSHNLVQELDAFKEAARNILSKPIAIINKFDKAINYDE